jgi:hypothetical protein
VAQLFSLGHITRIMKTPIIITKDNPDFTESAHIEVTVRFDWEWEDAGKNRDVVVSFMLVRGEQSLSQLRAAALIRAKEILQEAFTTAPSS